VLGAVVADVKGEEGRVVRDRDPAADEALALEGGGVDVVGLRRRVGNAENVELLNCRFVP
jgi:hypothetical protein